MVFEPQMGITPSRISSYSLVHGGGVRYQDLTMANKSFDGTNKHRGEVSKKAAKSIRSKVEWLVFLSKKRRVYPNGGGKSFDFQVNFITLTLPAKQRHDDNEIKSKCLNQFLTECRQKFNMKNYVWKAELQGNDNIHFHITTDTFIHHETIRNIWNRITSKLGYVQDYQRKMSAMSFGDYVKYRGRQGSADMSRLRKAYNYGQKSEWTDPNSTDVKSVKNVKNLAAYLSKYMIKDLEKKSTPPGQNERLKAFAGNLWYCSTSLSRLSTYKTHPSKAAIDFGNTIARLKSSLVKLYDYCDCVYFRLNELPPNIRKTLDSLLYAHARAVEYPFQYG